ncbi:MAG: hypothetical protein JRN29_01725 [Nitrososphaerota archaeon]|nr:hypothetical protein [Nitrososphaerota archaeon]
MGEFGVRADKKTLGRSITRKRMDGAQFSIGPGDIAWFCPTFGQKETLICCSGQLSFVTPPGPRGGATFQLKLPDIGEGEIVKWLVGEGDRVRRDQAMVEVVTDKVNVQVPAPSDGTVLRILLGEGKVARAGDAMAEMLPDDGPPADRPA